MAKTFNHSQVHSLARPINTAEHNLYQYPVSVRGLLLRRYKRFLADVVLLPTSSCGDRGAAPPIASIGVENRAAGVDLPRADGGENNGGGSDGGGESGGCGDRNTLAMEARSEGTGATITCHCPNTGPMTGLLDWPMAPVVCSVSTAGGRKYAHTLEMIQSKPGGAWVGAHSALANRLVQQLLELRLLPQLGDWREVQREVPYGNRGSRVDFVLTRPTGRRVFIEVKSVTLAEPYSPSAAITTGNAAVVAAVAPATTAPATEVSAAAAAAAAAAATATCERVPEPASPVLPRQIALFPDTVSDRAQRHMEDLMEVVAQGHEAVCVFVIQRGDCELFAPCVAKDPTYARLVRQAAAQGVQVFALRMSLRPATTSSVAAPSFAPTVATAPSEEASLAAAVACSTPASIVYLGPADLDLEYGSTMDTAVMPSGEDVPTGKKRGRSGRRTATGGGNSRRRTEGKAASTLASAGADVAGQEVGVKAGLTGAAEGLAEGAFSGGASLSSEGKAGDAVKAAAADGPEVQDRRAGRARVAARGGRLAASAARGKQTRG